MNVSKKNEIVDDDSNEHMNNTTIIDNSDDTSLLSLSKRVDKIQQDIDRILILLQTDFKNNCDKLSEHIDFVDGVYTKLKSPIDYIVARINNTRDMLPST